MKIHHRMIYSRHDSFSAEDKGVEVDIGAFRHYVKVRVCIDGQTHDLGDEDGLMRLRELAETLTRMETPCVWREVISPEYRYVMGCNNDGGPQTMKLHMSAIRSFSFCPGCGRRIEIVGLVEDGGIDTFVP